MSTGSAMVSVPLETLRWWRRLVDLNPTDLAPRIDAYLEAAPASPPNDAAVNAESAAKLVSDEALELAKRCETMANFIWTELNELTRAKRHECEDILCKAGKWIERHATTQTQATHGEGEAVALPEEIRYESQVAPEHRWRYALKRECDYDSGYYLKIRPAPSPTAAPALGELAKRIDGQTHEEWHNCIAYSLLRNAVEVCEASAFDYEHARHNAANLKNRIDAYLQSRHIDYIVANASTPAAALSGVAASSEIAGRAELLREALAKVRDEQTVSTFARVVAAQAITRDDEMRVPAKCKCVCHFRAYVDDYHDRTLEPICCDKPGQKETST